MINIASKAGSYLRATNQVVASGLRPLAGAALSEKKVVTENRELSTVWSLTQALPANNVSVKVGLTSKYSDSLTYSQCPLFIYLFSTTFLKII